MKEWTGCIGGEKDHEISIMIGGETMNLWAVFPVDMLMSVDGVLCLPLFAIPLYLYVFYAIFSHQRQRVWLLTFLGLTFLSSAIMLMCLGPNIGRVIPPFLLLLVIFMPLALLLVNIAKKQTHEVRLWALVMSAGVVHSFSWVVWLFALARS